MMWPPRYGALAGLRSAKPMRPKLLETWPDSSSCWPTLTMRQKSEVVTMHVTEVDISFVKPQGGLIAFASTVVDDQLYLSGIAIHRKLDGSGHRLTYPTRKVGTAQFSLFHPIRRPAGQAIERAILDKLKDVTSKHDVGHDRLDLGRR
jgi:DNA-binding cell septation regulator SpoVG